MGKREELLEIAKTILGKDNIVMESSRRDVEEWDSLAHVMLISSVKEKLGIIVPVEDVEKIVTIKDFMNYEK